MDRIGPGPVFEPVPIGYLSGAPECGESSIVGLACNEHLGTPFSLSLSRRRAVNPEFAVARREVVGSSQTTSPAQRSGTAIADKSLADFAISDIAIHWCRESIILRDWRIMTRSSLQSLIGDDNSQINRLNLQLNRQRLSSMIGCTRRCPS